MGQDETPRSEPPAVELLTVNEVSARYKIGRSLLRELARNGEIPVIRFGSHIHFLPQTVERWLMSQERVEAGQ
jgi:excisionase family DNA binding protein